MTSARESPLHRLGTSSTKHRKGPQRTAQDPRKDRKGPYRTTIICLLGRVTLVAYHPTVVKLSGGRSVGAYVHLCIGLSSALWNNGGSDPDAVWHHS